MKTTLDLPDALLSEIEARAVQTGQGLSDAVSELIRKGLAASSIPALGSERAVIKKDPRTGLPYIECPPGAPISKMSANEIYAVIHDCQEELDVERFRASLRR
jgi:hypothetical protein